jgi:hypothetical protein
MSFSQVKGVTTTTSGCSELQLTTQRNDSVRSITDGKSQGSSQVRGGVSNDETAAEGGEEPSRYTRPADVEGR